MNSAIIVAGGTGTRMKSETPKQFLILDKKPMLCFALAAFANYDPGIQLVIVLPEAFFSHWEKLTGHFSIDIPHLVIPGGKTRFHSVQNGLNAIESDGLVAIHDGARPLLSKELIRRTFDSATKKGNAIPAVPVNESIRIVESGCSMPVDRNNYRLVQTPQVFKISRIRDAYKQDYRIAFTDDATVAEAYGENINLVEGDPVNIKITHSGDLAMAEVLLRTRETTH